MRKIRRIVVHCSDSAFGDAELIRSWHLERGFADIGYHYVVLNGRPKTARTYTPALDGRVEEGRPLKRVGAHVYGHNKDTIGICIVGRNRFSLRQIEAAKELVMSLCERFGIPSWEVLGHCELNPKKTCPNMNMDGFRDYLDQPWDSYPWEEAA